LSDQPFDSDSAAIVVVAKRFGRTVSSVIDDLRGHLVMPEYRAYIVGADGHFLGFEPIVCASDEGCDLCRQAAGRRMTWSYGRATAF
jgi:hypothetical protein